MWKERERGNAGVCEGSETHLQKTTVNKHVSLCSVESSLTYHAKSF